MQETILGSPSRILGKKSQSFMSTMRNREVHLNEQKENGLVTLVSEEEQKFKKQNPNKIQCIKIFFNDGSVLLIKDNLDIAGEYLH